LKGKKVIVSVINDLSTDQRVRKSCEVLVEMGAEVVLVGRRLPASLPLDRPYRTVRFKLPVNKGFLFYTLFNLRLFWFLLWEKADVLFSNDLDTLLPNFLVSKLKGRGLVYDTHEYFTGIPEIQDRAFVKAVWTRLESLLFPRLKHVITVNGSIADLYAKQYGKKVGVVRNIPASYRVNESLTRTDLDLPEEKRILILQGSGINVDRGAEEAVQAMQHLDRAVLLIIGGGDVYEDLQEQVRSLKIAEKVIFLERMPYERMMEYTALTDVGLSLDKDTNINYRFSLPNKLFDYLHAGIPVLSSSVVEVARIVSEYDVGVVAESHDPAHLAKCAEKILERRVSDENLGRNIARAANELCWENEKRSLIEILEEID
jgi:glycosyltransferase involved in cell wall biosynthesis